MQSQESQEDKEVYVVHYSNTIVYPRAVMIPTLNTLVAKVAVLRAGCFDYLACWT